MFKLLKQNTEQPSTRVAQGWGRERKQPGRPHLVLLGAGEGGEAPRQTPLGEEATGVVP